MGLFSWFREKFLDLEPEETVYKCPKCGSTDVGFFTVLVNFVQVMREVEQPKYIKYIECNQCKYKSHEDEDYDGFKN